MNTITIETTVHSPLATVWNIWNTPEHIEKWLHASDDWECVNAINNAYTGGTFSSTLRAKDNSVSFDLSGTYTKVEEPVFLSYIMNDKRTVTVTFNETADGVHIVETFEMEQENSEEMQRNGWQSILNNFKAYTESM